MRFAAGVLLLLGCLSTARVLLKSKRNVGWNRPDRAEDGTKTHTHVWTQRHRSWLPQRDDLELRMLWLPRRINSLEHDLVHIYTTASSRRQHKKMVVIAQLSAVRLKYYMIPGTLVPTACCRMMSSMAHTHTLTHTQKHCSWLSQRETLEARLLLYRGCVKAYTFGGLVWYIQQIQQQRSGAQNQNIILKCGFSIVLLGSSSAESDPVDTCQISLL